MIYKIPTAWVRSVIDGNKLENSFGDAWSTIVNAIKGNWGTLTYNMIEDKSCTVDVVKSEYKAKLDTTLTGGSVTINLPVDSVGLSLVEVRKYSGNNVLSWTEYVIEEGSKSLEISVTEGNYLITITGTARRL